MRTALAVLTLLLTPAGALASERWVAPGATGTDCTPATPCSLAEAVKQVNANPGTDVNAIHLAVGNYSGPLAFTGGTVALDAPGTSTSIGTVDVRANVSLQGIAIGGGTVAGGASLNAADGGFYRTLTAETGSFVVLSDQLMGATPAIAGSGSVAIRRSTFTAMASTDGPLISAAQLVLRQATLGSYDDSGVRVTGDAELTDVVLSSLKGALRIGGALTARFMTLTSTGGLVLGDGATATVRDSILHAPVELGAGASIGCTTSDIAPIAGCTADGGNTNTPDSALFVNGSTDLAPDSPAIDSADPAPDPYDGDGDARLDTRRVPGHCRSAAALPDRGGLEYQGGSPRSLGIIGPAAATVEEPVSFAYTESPSVFAWVLWDFGDGTTSPLPNPTHAYDWPGAYTVTLTDKTPGQDCHEATTSFRIGIRSAATGMPPGGQDDHVPPDWERPAPLTHYVKLPRRRACRLNLRLRHSGEARRLRVSAGRRVRSGRRVRLRLHRSTRVKLTVTLRSGARVVASRRFCR